MDNIKEMMDNSSIHLKARALANRINHEPYNPVWILYFGTSSNKTHKAVYENLSNTWTGVNEILFHTLENIENADETVFKNMSGEVLEVDHVREQIGNLMTNTEIFKDMNRVNLYCIFDTTDVKTAEEFRNLYLTINLVRSEVNVTIRSMLMLILNEDLNHERCARSIKQHLYSFYESNEAEFNEGNQHIYDSVFVLGNKLSGGGFLSEENSKLYSDIILLSNTVSPELDSRRRNIYTQAPAITAAYSYSMKPVKDIVLITLRGITDKLLEKLNNTNRITADELLEDIFRVENGRLVLHESVCHEVSTKLPNNDFLSLLPGNIDLNKSYREINEASYGCLNGFINNNHFKIIEKMDYDSYVSELNQKIISKLTAAELYETYNEDTLEEIFQRTVRLFREDENQGVQSAITSKINKKVSEEIHTKIIEKVLNLLSSQAENCTEVFRELKNSIDRMPVSNDRQLTDFYNDKLNAYLNNNDNSEKIFKMVFNISNNERDLLNILLKILTECFNSDNAYRLLYTQELYLRAGHHNEAQAETTERIVNELINNMNGKIRFFSNTVFPFHYFESYFLNANANQLLEILNERENPHTFFNTCDDDRIESIWFYKCRQEELI